MKNNFKNRLEAVFNEFYLRYKDADPKIIFKDCENPWRVEVQFSIPARGNFIFRNIKNGDEKILRSFRDQLSREAREMFCPYPWDNEKKLADALKKSVSKTAEGTDVSYLILNEQGVPVSHFFLWKAGGNPHSKSFGVEIPELGVAVADICRGLGLGHFSVRILQEIAGFLGCDGIELTTALSNASGWNTYLKTGFRHINNIWNPLEVDVTEAVEPALAGIKYREERQMVYVINQNKEQEILRYLEMKRNEYRERAV
jgi:hypothetical protein